MRQQPKEKRAGQQPDQASIGPHAAQVIHKRDFIDSVVAATGAKKSDARPIIEATLEKLGDALSSGKTLAVPPLGRCRVNLEKDQRGGDVITLRLRRRAGAPES